MKPLGYLLNKGRLTNAAILLFGKAPQRFLISSEIKCAHFHGTQVAKPIPSHQVYTGTVFELVDRAVDFVLSKIALSVGTRAESIQASSGRSDPACRSDQGRPLGSPEVSACLVHGIVSNGSTPAGRCWSNAISSVASETCCAIRPTRSTRFVVPPTASTTLA